MHFSVLFVPPPEFVSVGFFHILGSFQVFEFFYLLSVFWMILLWLHVLSLVLRKLKDAFPNTFWNERRFHIMSHENKLLLSSLQKRLKQDSVAMWPILWSVPDLLSSCRYSNCSADCTVSVLLLNLPCVSHSRINICTWVWNLHSRPISTCLTSAIEMSRVTAYLLTDGPLWACARGTGLLVRCHGAVKRQQTQHRGGTGTYGSRRVPGSWHVRVQ